MSNLFDQLDDVIWFLHEQNHCGGKPDKAIDDLYDLWCKYKQEASK